MAFRKIGRTDASYNTLKKGYNLRWPSNGNPGADYVYICSTADDILAAANDALKNNCRITVRSGGHCYEGFVSNAQATPNSLPNGIGTTPQGLLPNQKPLAIIDVGLYTGSNYDPQGKLRSPYSTNSTTYKFRAAVGNQNWDNYIALYKSSGKTIPGGSCYSVGLGGHISGGGYGLLSRLHGLTVDWLSGVDILVPSSNGRQLIPKHVNAKSTGDDALLFIACKGGGGGNFGIITNYYFADLPDAPQQAYWLTLSFPWEHWTSVGKERFGQFLQAYWKWFSDHDDQWYNSDPSLSNGGLYTLMHLSHISTGPITISIQYVGGDGTITQENSAPLVDFVNTMTEAAGTIPEITDKVSTPIQPKVPNSKAGMPLSDPLGNATLYDWFALTQTVNTIGANQNGKYKSVYQIGNFNDTAINALWNNLSVPNPLLTQSLVQIDSYGGAINAFYKGTENTTSVFQRSSILKWQYQTYWSISNEEECQAEEIANAQIAWIRKIYSETFADQGGKPYPNDTWQGCYINYPDNDMKYTDYTFSEIDPKWLELHYGDRVDALIATKNAIDPNNVFYHQMSIPLTKPNSTKCLGKKQ